MSYFFPFICGAVFYQLNKIFPFITLLSALALLVFLIVRNGLIRSGMSRSGIVPVFIMVIAAVSGFYYSGLSYSPSPSVNDIAGDTIEIQGIVRSEPMPLNPESGMFSHVIEVKKATDTNSRPVIFKELRVIGDEALITGMAYIADVNVSKDACLLNPGSNRKVLSGYIVNIKEGSRPDPGLFTRSRLRLNAFLKGNFSAGPAAFLMSIITGERSLLSKEMNNAFNVTGLAHILSISGSHFGMLFFFLFSVSVLLTRLIPYSLLVRLTLYLTPQQIAAAICVPFVICYLGISDMGFPAVRSFIMIIFFLLGLLLQRKGAWLNTLLFAAMIIVIIQPDSVLDLSFQLSFIAVLCIGLVAQKSSSQQEVVPQAEVQQDSGEAAEPQKVKAGVLMRYCFAAPEFLRSSMLISLAATIGTAPLVTYYFHYFSLVSPLTNLLITPLIGFVILPLGLISSFFFLVFGQFPFLSITDWITGLVLVLIKHIAQWPFMVIKIPAFPPILLVIFYAGLALYVVLKFSGMKGRKGTLLLPAAISVLPIMLYICIRMLEPAGMQITFLDVGEGDAAVIELPGGKTVVADTGKNGFQAGEYLRYRGVSKIEAVMLSHGDNDHAGGWKYLRDNFQVSELWDNGYVLYEDGIPETIRHRVLQRGDVIEGQGYSITALHPYEDFYSLLSQDNINNDSLVVKIEGKKNSFMFTGDIEKEGAENVSYLGKYLKSSILKVPHHGSRSSASEPFFSAVAPEIAVISAGRKNSYNHPHPETLELLSKAKIYRTDIDGAIGIREMADGSLRIRTAKDFQLSEAYSFNDEILNVKRLFWVW